MRTIGLIFLLLGCGSDPAQQAAKDDSTAAPVESQAVDHKDGSPASSIPSTASEKAPEQLIIQSLTADTKADLPACDGPRNRQLVYVTEDSTFYTCKQSQWSAIDIKGAKGDKGDTGAAGADGTAGKDGQTVSNSMWYDPIGMRYWTFTTVYRTFGQATAACTGDWRLPMPAEIAVAFSRGLSVAVSSSGLYWSNAPEVIPVDKDGQLVGGAAYALCVQTK